MKHSRKWLHAIVLAVIIVTIALGALPVAASSQPQPDADVHVIRTDESGIELEVRTPSLAVQTAQDRSQSCQEIAVDGYVQSDEAGRPQLPTKVLLLGVPPQVELALEVTDSQTKRVAGAKTICAAPQTVYQRSEAGEIVSASEVAHTDKTIYDADAFYPSELARVEDLGFARSQRIVRLEISPFQVNPVTGEVRVHEQVRVKVRFLGDPGQMSAVAEPEAFEAAFRQTLANYEVARGWRSAPKVDLSPNAWTPPQPGYKLKVKTAGMYQLSYSALADAGLPVTTLDPRTLKIFSFGKEIAIAVTGETDGRLDPADAVLFYGEGVNTRYTDTNIYWLTYGGVAGKRIASRSSAAGGVQASSFRMPVRMESNLLYVSSLPMQATHDHWYGQRVQASGAGNPGRRDLTVAVANLASGDLTASLEVLLAGNVTGRHHLRLYVNGQQIHDDSWTERTLYNKSIDFPQSYLREGNNTIRVELVNDTPNQFIDMVYVDWLQLKYQRTFAANDNELTFGSDQAGARQYAVTGFGGAEVDLYDITDPAQVVRIDGAVITPEGGAHTLSFGDNQTNTRNYIALTPAKRLAPLAIEADTASNLQATSNGADYLIITHRDFREALAPLATHRTAQGLRVQMIDVQDIYDEFGFGMMSAEAIRDFIAHAFSQWTRPSVSFVLLVGDGTYDLRQYLPTSSPTYLPPYLAMVDPDLGETAADNRFVTVVGNDIIPDLHIGRFPVNTAAEATVLVDKTLAYEAISSDAAWTKNIMYVTDDLEGGGGDFYKLSDDIADGYIGPPGNQVKLVPDTYTASKIYMGKTCAKENPSTICRNQIIEGVNNGALFVSFIGHGTKNYWAEERLYDLAALDQLTNSERLPIMLPMTCNEGFFHEAQTGSASLSELGIRKPSGGTVASWAPTGFGLSTGHDYLERGLLISLFHDGVEELGAAATEGKLYLIANAPPNKYRDLIDTFLLLGDPALRVPLQAPKPKPLFLPLLLRRS